MEKAGKRGRTETGKLQKAGKKQNATITVPALQKIKKTTSNPQTKSIRWMTEELRELSQGIRAEKRLRNHKMDENLT
jgi:hypothetical protein